MIGILEILMSGLWISFTAYAVWFTLLAKHYAPLTPTDVRILWRIHKQNIRCSSRRWREIKRGNEVVGFECECGYKHIQKRPIVAHEPTDAIKTQSPADSLHVPYR